MLQPSLGKKWVSAGNVGVHLSQVRLDVMHMKREWWSFIASSTLFLLRAHLSLWKGWILLHLEANQLKVIDLKFFSKSKH